jgi:hypothetical protein
MTGNGEQFPFLRGDPGSAARLATGPLTARDTVL